MGKDFIKTLILFLAIISIAWSSLYFIDQYGNSRSEDNKASVVSKILNFNPVKTGK